LIEVRSIAMKLKFGVRQSCVLMPLSFIISHVTFGKLLNLHKPPVSFSLSQKWQSFPSQGYCGEWEATSLSLGFDFF
jgi:hypothetical protein